MVVLITDNDVYYELRTPGVTAIGRASSNDVIPESRSISKQHAVLTIEMTYGRIEMWIEDLNSTNGTYLGPSPLEIHKISVKEEVIFGDYLRFGHSSQYFRVLESVLPGTGTISAGLQDLSSDESAQDYLDRSGGRNESLMFPYHGEEDGESGSDGISVVPHPVRQPKQRLSRSTPTPYQAEDNNKLPVYSRRSAEYPRNVLKEHPFRTGPTLSEKEKENRMEKCPDTSRSEQNNERPLTYREPRNNLEVSVDYKETDPSSDYPLSVTKVSSQKPNKKIQHLWESPFSPSADEEGSQIFPDSSQDLSPSPLRFRKDYDYNMMMSNNVSNDPSINHSSIFNNSKNFMLNNGNKSDSASEEISADNSNENENDLSYNNSDKMGSVENPRTQNIPKPDINFPHIVKQINQINKNYPNEKSEGINVKDDILQSEIYNGDLIHQADRIIRQKSIEKVATKNVMPNIIVDEESDKYNSGLIQIPIRSNSGRNSKERRSNENDRELPELRKYTQNEFRSNLLPAQKNTSDTDSREWGFGLSFPHQNQGNMQQKSLEMSNLQINNTKIYPEIFSIARIAQSIMSQRKKNNHSDTNTSSISRSFCKLERISNKSIGNNNNIPLTKIDLEKEGLNLDDFSFLISNDNYLADQLMMILGPNSIDKIPNNFKGIFIFIFIFIFYEVHNQ